MFTGIIQKTAKVISAEQRGKCRIVHLQKPYQWTLRPGASIAVNGICSTVRTAGATYFEVEYMPETLSKTTAGSFAKGMIVNLERARRLNEVVDGHFVQGHVDARGKVVATKQRGSSKEIVVRVPRSVRRFIASKGSITLNGVSLTVAAVNKILFSVALVSYTLKNTNLNELARGSSVNIETDLIARHLARLRGK